VAVPVIVAAASIAVLATVNRELIIPRYQTELVQKPNDLARKTGRPLRSCYDEQTDILIRGTATYTDQQRISEPSFLLPDGTQLIAKDAYYQAPQQNRPGGFLFVGVTQPKDLSTLPPMRSPENKPVILTHREANRLKPDECFVVSNATFELLTKELAFASTAELITGLRNPSVDFGHQALVDIHVRMVRPFLDVTLLLLGLPLVMTRENRNVFAAIGLCILVVSLFVLVTWTLQALGTSCLIAPHLAAWAPLLIFVPIAVGMASSMWK
jgi:lipopolysaccharide export system permease protein